MGILSLTRWLFRAITKACFYTLIITFTITFFPLLNSIEGGITFCLWNHAQIWTSIQSLTFELESKQFLDYWNVPGNYSIRQFQDESAPFFIPSIATDDWMQKLGITVPNEHTDPETSKVDSLATLDGITRYSCGPCGILPTEMWVYVTDWAMPDVMPWDKAFDQVLQHMHVNPMPVNRSIHYLHCGASDFMCSVWNVKAPSLVLFTVDDTNPQLVQPSDTKRIQEETQPDFWQAVADSMRPVFTYPVPESDLLPITPRVIELPLENTTWLLPSAIFPTEHAQLSALLSLDLDTIKSRIEPYSKETQMLRRYVDHRFRLRHQRYPRRTLQWWIGTTTDWYEDDILYPLLRLVGIDEDAYMNAFSSPVFQLGFLLSSLMTSLAYVPFQWAWQGYAWYMGLAVDGTPIQTQSLEDAVASGGGNWLDDMMGNFWESVMANITDPEEKEKMRAAMAAFAAGGIGDV